MECTCDEGQKEKLLEELKLLSNHVSVLSRNPSKEEGRTILIHVFMGKEVWR